MKNCYVVLFFSVFLCSCATILTGSKKNVVFDSNVKQPVTLTVDGYKMTNITLPYTFKVRGGFSQTVVKAETEGYEPSTLVIDKKFNGVTIANVIIGGIIGLGVDAASGAMTKPEFAFYQFEFTPIKNSVEVVQQ